MRRLNLSLIPQQRAVLNSAAEGRRIRSAAISLYSVGLLCLGVALLAPHAHSGDGGSFFEVARASRWDQPGDWMAVWCSLKIILMCMGTILVLIGVGVWSRIIRVKVFGTAMLLVCAIPAAGVVIGAYYLVKALL